MEQVQPADMPLAGPPWAHTPMPKAASRARLVQAMIDCGRPLDAHPPLETAAKLASLNKLKPQSVPGQPIRALLTEEGYQGWGRAFLTLCHHATLPPTALDGLTPEIVQHVLSTKLGVPNAAVRYGVATVMGDLARAPGVPADKRFLAAHIIVGEERLRAIAVHMGFT